MVDGESAPSTILSRPRAARSLRRRSGDRLGRWIAQAQQNVSRALRMAGAELPHRFGESREPEIRFTFTTLYTIKKRRDVDQLRPRLHEIKIQRLVSCHAVRIRAEGTLHKRKLRLALCKDRRAEPRPQESVGHRFFEGTEFPPGGTPWAGTIREVALAKSVALDFRHVVHCVWRGSIFRRSRCA
jgi:hypothetical protein